MYRWRPSKQMRLEKNITFPHEAQDWWNLLFPLLQFSSVLGLGFCWLSSCPLGISWYISCSQRGCIGRTLNLGFSLRCSWLLMSCQWGSKPKCFVRNSDVQSHLGNRKQRGTGEVGVTDETVMKPGNLCVWKLVEETGCRPSNFGAPYFQPNRAKPVWGNHFWGKMVSVAKQRPVALHSQVMADCLTVLAGDGRLQSVSRCQRATHRILAKATWRISDPINISTSQHLVCDIPSAVRKSLDNFENTGFCHMFSL